MSIFGFQDVFKTKQNVLFVTAHPDDILIFYAALVLRLTQEGKDVFTCTVTDGHRGSGNKKIAETELAAIRRQEEIDALRMLGVKDDHMSFLEYRDGEVESDMKLIGKIAFLIRKYKIDIVCTHEPSIIYTHTYDTSGYFVQHRDHRKTAEAVIDAVYPFSRDRSFFPEQLTGGVEPRSIYDIILSDENGSNMELDFTETVEQRKEAMRLHKSQFDEATVEDIVESMKDQGKYLEKYRYLHLVW